MRSKSFQSSPFYLTEGDVARVAHRHVPQDVLHLEELWDVEADGDQDGGEDVGHQVDPAGVGQPVAPVLMNGLIMFEGIKAEKTTDLEGSADCQPALRGDAHDEVALPAHQDVLQGNYQLFVVSLLEFSLLLRNGLQYRHYETPTNNKNKFL